MIIANIENDTTNSVACAMDVTEEEEETDNARPCACQLNMFTTKVVEKSDFCMLSELPFTFQFDTNSSNPQGNPTATPPKKFDVTNAAFPAELVDPPIPQGVTRFRRGGFTRYHCREFVLEMGSREERMLFQALHPCSTVFEQSHFIRCNLKNRMAFGNYTLSNGAHKMLAEENAGGASELSEAMSFEIFHRVFNAELYKTEMGIQYNFEQGKRTDYLVHMNIGHETRCFAVSVTRAMKYGGVFTLDDADYLLRKKLYGVLVSNGNVLEEDRWDKQILHILCQQKYIADRLQQVFKQFQRDDPEFVDKTMILVTVCENANWIFTNRDEAENKTSAKTIATDCEQQWKEHSAEEDILGQGERRLHCLSCKQPIPTLGARGGDCLSALRCPLGKFDIGVHSQFLCSECKARRTMEALVAAMAVVAMVANNEQTEPALLMIVSSAKASPEGISQASWPIGRGFMWNGKEAGASDSKEFVSRLGDGHPFKFDEKKETRAVGDTSPFVSLQMDLDPKHSPSVHCSYCGCGHQSNGCFQSVYDSHRCAGKDQKEAEQLLLNEIESAFKPMKKRTNSKLIPKIVMKLEESYQKRFH